MEKNMLKKTLVVGIIFLFIGLSVFPSTGSIIKEKNIMPFSRGKTLYVGGSGPGNYTSIQEAIDNANDGDTVFVYDDNSPYYENILIEKSISLIGENRDTTVIDGKYDHNVIYVNEINGVYISGFTVQNSGSGRWGIELDESSNNIIKNNNIVNNYWGLMFNLHCNNNIISDNSFINNSIYVWDSYQNIIVNNSVNGNPLIYYEGESNKILENVAGQIVLVNCDNIKIRNQEISNTTISVELFKTNNCRIYNSTFSNNKGHGLYLQYSDYNIIYDNNIFSNLGGIGLHDFCDWNVISNNTILVSEYDGISIFKSYDNFISDNILQENGLATGLDNAGIYLGHDNDRNKILNNEFRNNYNGVVLIGSWSNVISDNLIVNSSRTGIHLECFSDKNIITDNLIQNNVKNGCSLFDSSDNIIKDNNISNNEVGIFFDFIEFPEKSIQNIFNKKLSKCIRNIMVDGCKSNKVYGNMFNSNKYGLQLKENTDDNIIYNNNFIDNFYHNAADIFCNSNIWMGNYWDDYSGEDNDSDGIGDTPYMISEGNSEDRAPRINPVFNNPLVASAGDKYTVKPRRIIRLNGIAKGGVAPYNYYWDLDNDGEYDDGEDKSVKYIWNEEGVYTVGLKVTDDIGDIFIDKMKITVSRTRKTNYSILESLITKFPFLIRLLSFMSIRL